MRTDYSRYYGEWNYRAIDRKLFVEELLKHADGRPVSQEAKVHVFGDTSLCAFYFHDRLTDQAHQSLYDAHGNAYDFDRYCTIPLRWSRLLPPCTGYSNWLPGSPPGAIMSGLICTR